MSDSDEFEAQPTPQPKADRVRGRTDNGDDWELEDSKVTDPMDWLSRDLDDSERDLQDRLGYRDSGAGVSAGRFVQLITVTDQREKRARKRHRKVVDVLREIRHAISPETIKNIESTVDTVKTAKRIAVAVVLSAAASLAGGIATYSAHERQAGAEEVRLKRAEDDIKEVSPKLDLIDDRCRKAVDQLRIEFGRHSSINVSQPATTLATKGPTT